MSIEVGSGGGAFVLGEDEEDSEEEEEEEEEDVCQEEKVAADAVAEDSTKSGGDDSRSSSVPIAGQKVSSAQAMIESNVFSEGKTEGEEEKEKTSAGGDVEIDLKEKKRTLVGKKDVSRQSLVDSIGGEEIDLQGLLSRSDVLRKHKRRVKLAVQGLNEWKFASQRDVEQKLSVDTSLKSIHLMVKGALSDMQAARDSMKHAMQLTETTK